MSLSTGDRLGRYEVLGPVGAGGMGEVWRARDSELEREVAVKVLPTSMAAEPRRVERFRREARALAALSHPNLLEVYDVGASDGIHFVVTELLEGETLRAKIPPAGLPWQKVVELGAAAADGLAAAHTRGVVHRDLKPENLFITSEGRLKILDFGLARVADEEQAADENASATPTVTDEGTVLGTAGYMAPEQVRGRPADARSDVFSIGCVLYEMAAGRRAFRGDSAVEVMAAVLKEEPPQLSSSGARVPVDLERTVHRCLEKKPEARFQSAADLAYSLRGIGSGASAPVMAAPGSGALRRSVLTVSAVLVVLAALLGWWLLRDRSGSHSESASGPHLEANRIAVLPFVNQSGDPSLDRLASSTAVTLEQGLTELDELVVTPASAVSAAAVGADSGSLVRSVAQSTGSGLALTGTWDVGKRGLRLQATLEDVAASALIHAFEPIECSRESSREATNTLRDWTLMAVQDHLHPEITLAPETRFPDYAAYQLYRRFFEEFSSQGAEARMLLIRATELDPEFARPHLLFGAIWLPGLDMPYQDRARQFYLPVKELTLSPAQQRLVRQVDARMAGRWDEALRLAREELSRRPHDQLQRATMICNAVLANRPQLAVDEYRHFRWDPAFFGAVVYVVANSVSLAYHQLGRHEEELELARQLTIDGPVQTLGSSELSPEMRALAALGRVQELDALITELLVKPPDYTPVTCVMLEVADELRAHGRAGAARELAERALAHQEGDAIEAPGEIPPCRAHGLMSLGRWDEARTAVERALARHPDSSYWWAMRGVCAARLGDAPTARASMDHLAELGDPVAPSGRTIHPLGRSLVQRAMIAAALGERDLALDLLRRAFAAGHYFSIWFQTDPMLEPLWGDPEFEEILRPRD